MTTIPRRSLTTRRLTLRPSCASDIERAFEIRSDWQVARMLRAASFPPDRPYMEQWFVGHEQEWLAGTAYRFAIDLDGRMIGLIDIDVVDGEGVLGYWLDRAAWGQGYAFEAAQAVMDFAFGELGLPRLRAGRAEDNPASGRVLLKLGFQPLDVVERFYTPRGQNILQHRYVLTAPDA